MSSNSATYTRFGGFGSYYYEAIQVTVSTTGSYTFLSSSGIDTYGYLYPNNISGSDLSTSLITSDDDSGGGAQFRFTATLEAGRTYIVIFTTYAGGVTGPFTLTVSGPARVGLARVNLVLTPSSSSTTSSTMRK